MATCWQIPQSSSVSSASEVVGWSYRWACKLGWPQGRCGLKASRPESRMPRVRLRVSREILKMGTACQEGCQWSSSVIRAGSGRRAVERDVRTQAGRSKAKRKGGGGKIEKRIERKPDLGSPAKKKMVKDEEPDPGVRQPDDYYIYGRYGPHWWKAGVIGKPIEGTLGDKIYCTFSSMDGDKDFEEQAKVDATINYDNKLKQLDEEIGLHYYWVFARSVRMSSVRLAPWEEWTLVAQVAVESATEPDKWTLAFRLDKAMRNVITQCVAWCRPDLTYVKKPKYQMRTENQLEFIRVLVDLVNPDTESYEGKGSYFAKLCRMLAVDVNVTEEDAAAAYDKLSSEQRMKVVEHLLTNHPVELLYPFTWGRRRAELRQKQDDEAAAEFQRWQEEDDEVTEDEEEGEEEDEEIEVDEEDDEPTPWAEYKMFGGREGLKEGDFELDEVEVIEVAGDESEDMGEIVEVKSLLKDERVQKDSALGSEDEENSVDPLASSLWSRTTRLLDADDSEEINRESLLKAAVRPFTYRNLVKEVVFVRRMLVEDPWRP